MELPDGTKIPSVGVSPNHSFKAIPIIRSVATMEKIAEAEEDDFDENCERNFEDVKEKKFSLLEDSEVVQARRVRRERRMSERRLSRTLTATVLLPSRQDSVLFSSASVKSFQGSLSTAKLVRPMSRKDIFFSGSIRNMTENDEAGIKSNRESLVSFRGRRGHQDVMRRSSLLHDSSLAEPRKSGPEDTNDFLDLLKSMLNPTIMMDPKFTLLAISNFFGFLGFYIPFVYLPSMAEANGNLESDSSAFLLSIIGISNTLGRILTGWLSDLSWVDPLFVVNTALVLSSLSVFSMPFLTDYISFAIISSLFGLFIAAYIALTSIVLVDICGIENLTSAFGLLTVFRGVSAIIGPPLAGVVFEQTLSYNISFYLSASFLFLAALFSIAADSVRRISKNSQR